MSELDEHEYKIQYAFKLGKFKCKDIGENEGATDHVVLLSIVKAKDGSQSQALWSCNGDTGKGLSGIELFKAWWLMGASLGTDPVVSLPDGIKKFLNELTEHISNEIFAALESAQFPVDGEMIH